MAEPDISIYFKYDSSHDTDFVSLGIVIFINLCCNYDNQ